MLGVRAAGCGCCQYIGSGVDKRWCVRHTCFLPSSFSFHFFRSLLQMSEFSRNVAAFEESVLQNFRDVQDQLAQASRTNRGNAQQIMSLKQMTRIVARMVAIQPESTRKLTTPSQQRSLAAHAHHNHHHHNNTSRGH